MTQLDRDVRAARRRRGPAGADRSQPDEDESPIGAATADGSGEEDSSWKEALLARLHRFSPAGFEEFTVPEEIEGAFLRALGFGRWFVEVRELISAEVVHVVAPAPPRKIWHAAHWPIDTET